MKSLSLNLWTRVLTTLLVAFALPLGGCKLSGTVKSGDGASSGGGGGSSWASAAVTVHLSSASIVVKDSVGNDGTVSLSTSGVPDTASLSCKLDGNTVACPLANSLSLAGQVNGYHTLAITGPSGFSTSRKFYVHDSLNGAATCSYSASDEAYFNTAATWFANNAMTSATVFSNPDLVGPENSAVFPDGLGGAGTETREWVSLRKYMVKNSAGDMLLLKRAFISRINNNCKIPMKFNKCVDYSGTCQVSHEDTFLCDAIAFSSSGRALCLDANAAVVTKNVEGYPNVVGMAKYGSKHLGGRKDADPSTRARRPWFSPKTDDAAWWGIQSANVRAKFLLTPLD